jgi:hypothetical protein
MMIKQCLVYETNERHWYCFKCNQFAGFVERYSREVFYSDMIYVEFDRDGELRDHCFVAELEFFQYLDDEVKDAPQFIFHRVYDVTDQKWVIA